MCCKFSIRCVSCLAASDWWNWCYRDSIGSNDLGQKGPSHNSVVQQGKRPSVCECVGNSSQNIQKTSNFLQMVSKWVCNFREVLYSCWACHLWAGTSERPSGAHEVPLNSGKNGHPGTFAGCGTKGQQVILHFSNFSERLIQWVLVLVGSLHRTKNQFWGVRLLYICPPIISQYL